MRLHAGPGITIINGFVIKPHNNNKHGCFLRTPNTALTAEDSGPALSRRGSRYGEYSRQIKNILCLSNWKLLIDKVDPKCI